ncbi:spore germination protein [Ammoniphilus sp. 3BR4]|uniref:spore germination protein n=1 Tax=Ammoniphilus sp. 3BR4 TaxID=3158265 RepID=UPI003466A9BF
MAKWEKRSVEEPSAESVVRGPRDGFTETLGVNTSLLKSEMGIYIGHNVNNNSYGSL